MKTATVPEAAEEATLTEVMKGLLKKGECMTGFRAQLEGEQASQHARRGGGEADLQMVSSKLTPVNGLAEGSMGAAPVGTLQSWRSCSAGTSSSASTPSASVGAPEASYSGATVASVGAPVTVLAVIGGLLLVVVGAAVIARVFAPLVRAWESKWPGVQICNSGGIGDMGHSDPALLAGQCCDGIVEDDSAVPEGLLGKGSVLGGTEVSAPPAKQVPL